MLKSKTILVAPLHWGLGHATRCIPIIRALLDSGFKVLIASDGQALLLLQKEFPNLDSLELPAYNITYPKKSIFFRWNMIQKLPQIQKTISEEKTLVDRLVEKGKIHGIISDNRFGVRNNSIPSVFISHQLNVLSGSTTFVSSKIHQNTIKKFTVCWIPDFEDATLNLSGKLGHLDYRPFQMEYLGILSRMQKKELPKTIDILVLLSGPEPQRSLLEKILKEELVKSDKKIVLIRGIIKEKQQWEDYENIKTVNFMMSTELEETINKSEVVISRSGYTTIMDLAKLEKNAFFIPTPGQYEQEYLANRLKNLGLVPSCKQDKFKMSELEKLKDYKGLKTLARETTKFSELFSLFEGK